MHATNELKFMYYIRSKVRRARLNNHKIYIISQTHKIFHKTARLFIIRHKGIRCTRIRLIRLGGFSQFALYTLDWAYVITIV